MADEITDAIEESAVGPRKVQGDEATVEQHSLLDQIAADKYIASKAAMTGTKHGIRFTKLVPPGTV